LHSLASAAYRGGVTGEAASSNDLCTNCGICCTDAMFDFIRLEPGEADVLVAEGYPAARLDKTKFSLPCSLLVERKCSIYADRPAACRRFECEVLKAAGAGTMSLEEAHGLVRQAHGLLARLREVMPEGVSMERARARWTKGDLEPGSLDPAEAAAQIAFFAYNRFMDRHFKRPEKWLVTPRPGESPADRQADVSDPSNDVA
jgi:Fe-S-cluster containining protein